MTRTAARRLGSPLISRHLMKQEMVRSHFAAAFATGFD
jgi:hypothetical protein